MVTTYQLWDNTSNNLIEDYYNEREALDYVEEEIAAYGQEAVSSWALLRDDGMGHVTLIAEGSALASHARRIPEAGIPITGE
jgi:hypothetical protein